MATVDERVAFLEGRVNEQGQMITGIRDALVSFEQRMDRRFESLEQRLTALDRKVDAGFAAMNQKMDAGFAAQDHRFAWLVGIRLTTTAAGRHAAGRAARPLTRGGPGRRAAHGEPDAGARAGTR